LEALLDSVQLDGLLFQYPVDDDMVEGISISGYFCSPVVCSVWREYFHTDYFCVVVAVDDMAIG